MLRYANIDYSNEIIILPKSANYILTTSDSSGTINVH